MQREISKEHNPINHEAGNGILTAIDSLRLKRATLIARESAIFHTLRDREQEEAVMYIYRLL